MINRRPVARTKAKSKRWEPPRAFWMGLPLAAMALGLATMAFGETVIKSHGVSNFDALKYGSDMAHLDYVNPDAPKGGEFSQWSQATFDSFNLYTRKGVPAPLTGLMYESILTSAADDFYGAYCYICETLEYPESRDWVIFNLRPEVTFSDGSPMTAEDVKFSFDLVLEQGISEYRSVVESFVESVEVLGPHQIRYNFTDTAPFKDRLTFAGGTTIWSKTWFEETGARLDESTTDPFMGTGPYVVDKVDIGRQLIYKRNPNYWGADLPWNIGQNNFDSIRVEVFGDSQAAFEAFKAGEYTFRNENSSKTWGTGYDFPALTDGKVLRAELKDGTIGSAQAFVFNLDREVWNDPKVRAAVRLMFNFEWSNETLFFGLYERVNSFWENSPLEATGVPTEAEKALLQPLVDKGLLNASVLTEEAIMAPTSGKRVLDRKNLRAASALLDEAGWAVGEDGIRRKDGVELKADILSFSPAFDRIINPYVENLKRLGIAAKLDRVDVSQYVDRRRKGDFDMTTHSFGMGFEPGFGLRQWYSHETADDSSRNLMRLRNEAYDELINHVVAASTLDELETAVHALDRALRAEGFWVPQWFKDKHTVAYWDMYRHPEPLPPLALGELSFWWYDAEAHQRLLDAGALKR
ncbi:Oligopeptide ABC transporter, periplasmic oligopeptide-binding protein OppA [Candidatus Rhodobacter oscarellae]|uniref:Oligopeptide ABC transporter, periplasmic oligopeptide-binding protein OppA n=1 Tax=Candidatus Rhodobacter oscarellae TaxID=1675527 RepID=A0A0J9ECX4_9RHOB|nr:extracellular solute-binding protein [Candidatus Rhodobacter lobularis]KMW59589.1 Oligopeptide ABC transporter, periplasmic oligopeptide-binding protein OppA [Candidatus Rhodobacter lobularis]